MRTGRYSTFRPFPWSWESSTRSLWDFRTYLCPPLLLIVLFFVHVKRATGGPRILLYRNSVKILQQIHPCTQIHKQINYDARRKIHSNLRFKQIHVDPGNAVVLDYVQIYICGRFRELFRILGNSDL